MSDMKTLTYKDDIIEAMKTEGNYKEFTYKTIKCEIKRVSGLNHLCGYIHLNNVTNQQREIINDNFHLGITYEKGNVYGFDCAHVCDVVPSEHQMNYWFMSGNETYKTMEYVEDCLKRTIDELIKNEKVEF